MTDGRAPRPFRPPAPSPADLIRWPDTFGKRFIVFCDVEEEFDWREPLSRDARATTAMAAFPAAHRRFADLGVPLACMVDQPIASDPAAVEILSRATEDGRTAIGAQLHPWVTPPFDEPVTPVNSYLGNLPLNLQAAKIDTLTAAITDAFGKAPRAFRAVRYGLGAGTLRLLAERGYRLDSSERARYDYRADGGPDYRAIGNAAYRTQGLIELPFSTVFTGRWRKRGADWHRFASQVPHGAGVLARMRLVNRVSLTPEDMPIGEAVEAVSVAVTQGERLLAFAFHSPSLAPGHTPYVRDNGDLSRFWRWWEVMAAHLNTLGVRPVTLDEVIAAAG